MKTNIARWKAWSTSSTGAYTCSKKSRGFPVMLHVNCAVPGTSTGSSHAGLPPTCEGRRSASAHSLARRQATKEGSGRRRPCVAELAATPTCAYARKAAAAGSESMQLSMRAQPGGSRTLDGKRCRCSVAGSSSWQNPSIHCTKVRPWLCIMHHHSQSASIRQRQATRASAAPCEGHLQLVIAALIVRRVIRHRDATGIALDCRNQSAQTRWGRE